MARTDKSDTGKWVARAAATGGGKTYRGQRPVKWYASLVLICLLGISMIAYSRYERQHPTSTPPTVGTQWFAAIAFDICGTVQPDLPANPAGSQSTGVDTTGNGVISIAPTTSAQAGANATLGAFVDSYPGLVLTPSALRLPKKVIHHNGDTCASGTPDAGKSANVVVRTWPSFTAQGSTVSGDPTSVLLADGQLITVAFVPNGASIPKPSSQSIAAMQDAIQAA
ncbi:MAG TPA: hypothetical protein VED63_01245, partial [Acidimicrobiales bacterium]|nr:hypothetical protein [Acidimicrobiales bacterium]